MESYGAQCIYLPDSGGAMNMNDIRDRIRAFMATVNADSLGVANAVVAVEEGCRIVLCGWNVNRWPWVAPGAHTDKSPARGDQGGA